MSEFVTSTHAQAFQRFALSSKKTLPVLWKEEMRLCLGGSKRMPGVAGVTPPYGPGGTQSARAAEAQARAKVAADIYSLYGTPNEAYEAISDAAPEDAGAFWYLQKHGDTPGASQLLREGTGSILYPFDDGKQHRKNFLRRARAGRGFKFYVTDPQNLKAYIQLEQEQVWFLASGWLEPLEALGANLPAGVKRHGAAPGHLAVVINENEISITAGNDVKYGGNIRDMKRRMDTVMNVYRKERLDRMWEEYLKRLRRETGL